MQFDKNTDKNTFLENKITLLEKRLNNPKVDLFETNNTYIVRIELSVEKYRYELQENQILLITSEKLCNYEKKDCLKVLYKECRYGKIMRRVKLPFKVKPNPINENYLNGVLTLEYAKHVE